MIKIKTKYVVFTAAAVISNVGAPTLLADPVAEPYEDSESGGQEVSEEELLRALEKAIDGNVDLPPMLRQHVL